MKKRGRFLGRKEYFGSIFFDRKTFNIYPFDSIGTAILESLARHKPEDVAKAFSKATQKLTHPLKKSDALAFIEEWKHKRLIDKNYNLDAKMLPDKSQKDFLSAPLRVYVDFDSACNLRCLHCVSRSSIRKTDEMTTPDYKKALDMIAQEGVFELNVGGGEPFLRKDSLELLEYASNLGLAVSVTTNGTLINKELAKKIGEIKLRYLAISLDGASAFTHDHIRGKGMFARTLEGIKLLSSETKHHLNAHFTLMKHNLHELPDFFSLAEELPVHSIGIIVLRPAGRALDNQDLFLTRAEYKKSMKEMNDLANNFKKSAHLSPFMPGIEEEGNSRLYSSFGCGAGQVNCNLDSSGYLTPCNYFNNPGPKENLLDKGLSLIWQQGDFFNNLRNLEGNPKCLKCRHFMSCRGGCRAQAMHFYDDINAPDHYCMK